MNAPIVVRSEADILPAWRGTPIETLLRYHNLGMNPARHDRPELLVATCMEPTAALRIPVGFAVALATGGASLKRVPFKVSWAIGVAGVSAIALVAHEDCGMADLAPHRESFIKRLVATGGWARAAAEQHFDHWHDLFATGDPASAVVAEAARLRRRYPALPVAALFRQRDTGLLAQLDTP